MKIDAGPYLRASKVGDFANVEDDPLSVVPAEVAARFPAESEEVRCSPAGTWYTTVKETVVVTRGKKKSKETRHRLHWLYKEKLRVAQDLPAFHDIDFAEAAGKAILTADLGELFELDLETGGFKKLQLEGYPLTEASRLYAINYLQGGRVLVEDSTNDGVLVVAKLEAGKLRFEASFPFAGGYVVVDGRVLIGGAPLVVVDLAAAPSLILGLPELGCGAARRYGARVRTYSSEVGAWEFEGWQEAARAVDAGQLKLPPFEG